VEKLERLLDRLGVVFEPHGLAVRDEEPAALPQSILVPCVLL